MELKQAQQFLAVVDHGGLGRAAVVLQVSQSTLSHTVSLLEREMGARLFHRVGRGLVPTTAGEALVVPARRLVRGIAIAEGAVADAESLRGRLDIAAMGSPLSSILPVVGRVRSDHPQLTIRLATPSMEVEVIRLVREGQCEVGFLPLGTGAPLVAPGDLDLEVVRLGQDSLKVVLPPGTDPSLPDPLPLSMLPDLPVTAAPSGAHGRDAVETALRRAGIRTRIGVVTAHRSTHYTMVLHGIGMAFGPGPLTTGARARGAVVRDLDPLITLPYGVVRWRGSLSPAAQLFDHLACTWLRS